MGFTQLLPELPNPIYIQYTYVLIKRYRLIATIRKYISIFPFIVIQYREITGLNMLTINTFDEKKEENKR